MSYCLKPGRSISSEVRRIVDKQLALAIDELHGRAAPPNDEAIHEARRHVKKVRAIIRLVKPALGDAYDAINGRMRFANRMLAPIADAEGSVHTLARLNKRCRTRLARPTLAAVRAVLLERLARIDREAERDRVLPKVASVLRAERARFGAWTSDAHGFDVIAPGLERTVRRARKAMARAAVQPTADNYHLWRRRVKDLWFQVRLVERRCGNKLRRDQRRLEALDGCLGEYHNLVLLEDVLVAEPVLSRQETARCLHLLRRNQAALRDRALALGRRVTNEKPRRLVHRIERLWRSAKAGGRAPEVQPPWRRAA